MSSSPTNGKSSAGQNGVILPFMNASPIKGAKSKPKMTRSATVAERVLWMSRTSDVLGSFNNTGVEACTTLIRRKIQERCGTTQELMACIRRLKTGETSHVTPNEFRYTLIKFGISIPQALVEHIFNLFDSDRSGTIDFDEFAMWIMNSEFRPVKKEGTVVNETSEDSLRRRVATLYERPAPFSNLKAKFNFLELVAEIAHKKLPLSEKDARLIFQILDPYETGFVESELLRRWAREGITELGNNVRPLSVPSISAAIEKVCGKNTHMMEKCFAHVPRNEGVTMPYEEFRRCLLSVGLGNNTKDMQKLFLAAGGSKGFANIDTILNNLKSYTPDPATAVSIKSSKPVAIYQGRADRRLRENMRKCYKAVQAAFKYVDPKKTGYVDTETFYRVICNTCLSISYEDFRLIAQKIPTDENNRLSWTAFLSMYNPKYSLHLLEGSSSLPNFNQTASTSSLPPQNQQDEEDGLPHSQSVSSVTSQERASAELRRMWQAAIRACQRADTAHVGTVPRDVFMAIMQDCVGKSMTNDAIKKLADTYCKVEDASVDYNLCFRHYLNEFMNTLQSTKSTNTFKLAETTQARPTGPVHPWHFDYTKPVSQKDNTQPYWSRACTVPKNSRPMSVTSEMKSPFGFRPENSTRDTDLSKYEPKVIAICRKIGAHQNFRPFKDELKRAQLQSHKGCIASKNFLAIMDNLGITLSKNEMGTVMRVFRTLGLADCISFDPLIGVCLAAQVVSS